MKEKLFLWGGGRGLLSELYNISTLDPGWDVRPSQDYTLVEHNLQTCTH